MLEKLKVMFMERDGTTPCFVRIGVAVGQIAYFSLSGVMLHKGTAIDLVAWATGYMALIAGGAAGAILKFKTEDAPSGNS